MVDAVRSLGTAGALTGAGHRVVAYCRAIATLNRSSGETM